MYFPLLHGVIPRPLEAFDPVTQTMVTGQRDSTTVPTQAPYMLNAPFVRSQSLALAVDLLSERSSTTARVDEAYRRALGRRPTAQEALRARRFLLGYETTAARVVSQTATASTVDPAAEKADRVDQADQTDAERNAELTADRGIDPGNAKKAAWMSLIQALYASAEFRFVQ